MLTDKKKLLVKLKPRTPRKDSIFVSVLVSEQNTQQRQHNAQISHVSVQTYLCDLA